MIASREERFMRAAFYIGDPNLNPDARFFDRTISWWTKSPYTHVEWVFDNGMCFSASPVDGGCRFKNIDITTPKWKVVDVPWANHDEIWEFCTDRDGLKYDWLGIFLSQTLPLNVHDPNRWFCSEIVMASLQCKRPNAYNPADVYEVFTRNR